MKVLPRNDKIVVKRLEPKKVTKGGIHIPDTAKKDEHRAFLGVVIEVGPGRLATTNDFVSNTENKEQFRIPLNVQRTQAILFPKYAGWETELDGQKILVLKEEEILALVEGVRYEEVDGVFYLV